MRDFGGEVRQYEQLPPGAECSRQKAAEIIIRLQVALW
jgi:hypothetical protein